MVRRSTSSKSRMSFMRSRLPFTALRTATSSHSQPLFSVLPASDLLRHTASSPRSSISRVNGDDRSLSIIEDGGSLANEIPLSADGLCEVLQSMEKRIRLCVLNACASAELASRIVRASAADHAVGWPGKISDSAAIAFSRALYGALGDGRDIADAVDVAKVACAPDCFPVLVTREGSDAHIPVIGERDRV